MSTLTVLDTAAMLTTKPPPIEWLVDGVFARGKFAMFGGREKSGKSLVQLAFAMTMAGGGGTVAGIDVAPGRVLVLDAENGAEEIHSRLHKLAAGTRLDVAHAADLITVEARGVDITTDLDEIGDLIDEHDPDLVLLDSFRALWRGNERDEAEIATALYPVANMAHERCIAIGITHHATKGDSGDYRGSTAIGAVPDWICVLTRPREDEDRRRCLATPYCRFAGERDDRWLRIVRDGEGDESPVHLEAAKAFVPEHDAPVRNAVEAELWAWVSGVTSPKGGDTLTPSAWTSADLARAVDRDPKDQSVRRALDRLAADGVLYRGNDKLWRPLGSFFQGGNGNGNRVVR